MRLLRLLGDSDDTFKTVQLGPKLNLGVFGLVGPTLGVSGNAITVTHALHAVLTSGGSNQRRLDTINGGQPHDVLMLWLADGSQDCKINQNSNGNIRTEGSFKMTTPRDRIILVYDGAFWNELTRASNS